MNTFYLKEWKKKDITRIYHKWQKMNEESAVETGDTSSRTTRVL
ncbi:unnamed protein product [Musa acuminata subsp. malaccensis]|uniref:(wild Malaysian banana) hypothetical protein n=1 Tax=Musa acuminata subsp. malaccensis TaxID=214687 RepID=A0A804L4V7_MUSAM|nr:unnamed protein product [Musa acuminata subsp. malaccensis]